MIRPRVGVTPLPADVCGICRRVMLAAMALDEDANNCGGNPVPENWDDFLTSMQAMREALIRAYAEIEVG